MARGAWRDDFSYYIYATEPYLPINSAKFRRLFWVGVFEKS